jgi:hypothetical protein
VIDIILFEMEVYGFGPGNDHAHVG